MCLFFISAFKDATEGLVRIVEVEAAIGIGNGTSDGFDKGMRYYDFEIYPKMEGGPLFLPIENLFCKCFDDEDQLRITDSEEGLI